MSKFLLFSGGFDSTLLLAELVSHAKDGECITAFSLDYGITGEAKLRREYESQLLIIRELNKLYPKVTIKHEIVNIYFNYGRDYIQNVKGLVQPIFWISNMIPFLKDGDELYLGYIREDQAILQEQNIYDLFNAANRIQENKDIYLKLPNKYYDKCDIIEQLISNYPSLVEYCISCEDEYYNGIGKVCGKCVPCMHLKQALLQLSIHYDTKVCDKANQLLKDLFRIKVSITNLDENVDTYTECEIETEEKEDADVDSESCDTVEEA